MSEQIIPYENEKYSKSNFLISGKFKSSLYENKILAISLAKIAKHEYVTDPDTKEIVCSMRAAELKQMLGAKNGSFYDTLENTAAAMTSRSIGFSDPESHEFEYISLVTKADYKQGVFNIRYSPHFAPYIADLKSNYTVLSLPTMLNFDSVWTFRLYELLRSKCYYPKGQEREDGKYIFQISLAEIKLELGAVNADTDAVRKVLSKTTNPDYEKAIERSKEKTFDSWYEFRRKVLDKAISEIEVKTDMCVQYEPQKAGRGGKIFSLLFCVTKDIAAYESRMAIQKLTEDEKFDVEAETKFLFKEERLNLNSIRSICEAASYDVEKIRNAYNAYKASHSIIDNVAGWVVSAIKEGYESSKIYTNFEQRDYDIIDIESKLLKQ